MSQSRLLRPTISLLELVRWLVGGPEPKNKPQYAEIMANIVRDAQEGRLDLVSRCVSGPYAYSRVTRETAIAWCVAHEMPAPDEFRYKPRV